MSVQEPVEIVKEVWRRFAAGGISAASSLLADDLVWTSHDDPDRPVVGRTALVQHFRRMAVSGTRLEAVGHRFEDFGDCVVVAGRVRVLSKEGHYDVPMNWQVDVRDGRVANVKAERSVQQAREDCAASAAA